MELNFTMAPRKKHLSDNWNNNSSDFKNNL